MQTVHRPLALAALALFVAGVIAAAYARYSTATKDSGMAWYLSGWLLIAAFIVAAVSLFKNINKDTVGILATPYSTMDFSSLSSGSSDASGMSGTSGASSSTGGSSGMSSLAAKLDVPTLSSDTSLATSSSASS